MSSGAGIQRPQHIAIIMDGNGRWAEQRGFPRSFGHRSGAGTVREIVTACGELGIDFLTLYSFSSENWKRPPDEVKALMELCVMYCDGEREELVRENVRVRVIGRLHELPDDVRGALERVQEATASCTGCTLCLAINYGSRAEIVDACRSIASAVRAGDLDPDDVDEAAIESRLYTTGLPDPDLLIRTGGELRVSNYLLWQISYAELYVTETLWPDFDEPQLRAAVEEFGRRRRRFGGLDGAAASGVPTA